MNKREQLQQEQDAIVGTIIALTVIVIVSVATFVLTQS